MQATFTVPDAVPLYYSAESRRQADGSAYRGRVRIDSANRLHSEIMRVNGSSETVLAAKTLTTTVAPGQTLAVEVAVSDSTPVKVSSRTYLVGTAVPSWQATAQDDSSARITAAGSVGVHAYVGRAVAGTTTVRTQSVQATATTITAPAVPTPATRSKGSARVGSTSYTVPSGALFVSSSSGNDAAAGSQTQPLRTVTAAIGRAQAGQTIVLREGSYHESILIPPTKPLTIQAYPNEAVWFDGSRRLTNFVQSGTVWRADNWTAKFDRSPTYTRGAPDGTTEGWQFINSSYPLAAWPDQVWIDGEEQVQVSSLSAVKTGTFFVDYSTSRLYIGSNPAGKTVEASDLQQAMSLRAPGTIIRGLGVRRYASSVPQQGVITTYFPKMSLENVEVRDSGTAGVGIYAPDCSLKAVTIVGSGQMGLQAGHADRLVVDNVSLRDNNDQHFNATPAAGGFKVTETRGLTVKNSEFLRTDGNQIWTDMSVYDTTLVNNDIRNGKRWGIVLEISSVATVANNVISGNAFDGILVTNTDRVNIWNNTIVGNGKGAIWITQDSRRGPSADMSWVIRDISIGNNIYAAADTAQGIWAVQSWERAFNASELDINSNGNLYSQTAVGRPAATVLWAKKGTYATKYTSLADFITGTGQDRASYNLIGTFPVDSNFQPVSAVTSRESTVAQPLPSGVAAEVGKAAGTRHLGAWR